MRIVVDTNVFVAAVRSPAGASAELLRQVRRGRLTMLGSVALFLEYEAVAMRPAHLAAAGLEVGDIAIVLDTLSSFVEPVDIFYLWRPRLRDPDDDMVLEVAVNGMADAIVTFNQRDFTDGARQFGVQVLTPVEVLQRLGPV